jgi:hypothetical protein
VVLQSPPSRSSKSRPASVSVIHRSWRISRHASPRRAASASRHSSPGNLGPKRFEERYRSAQAVAAASTSPFARPRQLQSVL